MSQGLTKGQKRHIIKYFLQLGIFYYLLGKDIRLYKNKTNDGQDQLMLKLGTKKKWY